MAGGKTVHPIAFVVSVNREARVLMDMCASIRSWKGSWKRGTCGMTKVWGGIMKRGSLQSLCESKLAELQHSVWTYVPTVDKEHPSY